MHFLVNTDDTEMEKFDYPLILHCEAMKQGENPDNRYQVLVAAKAENTHQLDERINQAFKQQGYIFLYADQAKAADHYFEQANSYSVEAMQLCGQLNAQQTIAFKQVAILNHIEQQEPASYVEINEISIRKEFAQKGIPFWEREWIDPALKKLLFEPNLPIKSESSDDVSANSTTDTAPVRTYLIIDATNYFHYRGVFDIDLISDCPVMCMFTGEAAENLKHSAPYLFDITLDPIAYSDDSRISEFHKRYFEDMYGNDVGIFIQSEAPMKAIHQYFRKFLKFEVANGNNNFFRFWDPRVLKVLLPAISGYHKASGKFFNLPHKKHPPVTFIYEDVNPLSPDESTEKYVTIATKQASFKQQEHERAQQQVEEYGSSVNSPQELPLQEIVNLAFSQSKVRQYCDKTALWLIENYGEREFKEQSISEFLFSQLQLLESDYRLKLEYEVSYALAGCYLLGCDLGDMSDQHLKPLSDFKLSSAQRAENFLSAILKNSEQTSLQSKDLI